MKKVPPLAPCPECGIEIAKDPNGPNGLAWHTCGTAQEHEQAELGRKLFELVERNALNPDATMDDLAKEALRASVAAAVLTGEANPQSVGVMLQGVAAVKAAGGDTTLDDLLGFHEAEEEVA